MTDIRLIYGDEPQTIEEEKRAFFHLHEGLPVRTFTDAHDPEAISAELSEDSLFGDVKLILISNPPVFKKSGRSVARDWEQLADRLIDYRGEHPVCIVYRESIDKRLKANEAILKAIPHTECKRLSADALQAWLADYVRAAGFRMDRSGVEYLAGLLDVWQDVPAGFLKTEFDRLFLELGDEKRITAEFLAAHIGDYGAKNIFTFKDALLKKDVKTLDRLFPFICSPKESERALSYIEGQLRLQLVVSDCKAAGMSERATVEYFAAHGSKTKPYPIKLAYREAGRSSRHALANLLTGLYGIVVDSRKGIAGTERFRDICLAYCERT